MLNELSNFAIIFSVFFSLISRSVDGTGETGVFKREHL